MVLGNESRGVSNDVTSVCDVNILIETQKVESLNVAIAGSIIMNSLKNIK